MNENLEELASLYVLDQLDARERAAFEQRLLQDPELLAFVRTLEVTLSRTVRALPPQVPPQRMLSQIEREIAGDSPRAKTLQTPRPRTGFSWVSFARWGIAAVIALSLGTLAVQSIRAPSRAAMIVFVGLDSNRNVIAELPLRSSAQDPDARFIQLASLAEKFWEKPGELPVKPDLTLAEGRGYALLDLTSMQGFIAVDELPAIKANQRYHLWLVDRGTGQIRDAGVLPLSGTNRGLYSFTLGSTERLQSARPNLFITVEDSVQTSAPAQPRGEVVLGDRRI